MLKLEFMFRWVNAIHISVTRILKQSCKVIPWYISHTTTIFRFIYLHTYHLFISILFLLTFFFFFFPLCYASRPVKLRKYFLNAGFKFKSQLYMERLYVHVLKHIIFYWCNSSSIILSSEGITNTYRVIKRTCDTAIF